jgi:hypothetical protein
MRPAPIGDRPELLQKQTPPENDRICLPLTAKFNFSRVFYWNFQRNAAFFDRALTLP